MAGLGGARPNAGRKPKPTYMKKLDGNPGGRSLKKRELREPKPILGYPKMPMRLTISARPYWKEVCDLLNDMRVLSITDALSIAALCEAYADFVIATKDLEEAGCRFYESTNDKTGQTMIKAHPAVAIKDAADRRMRMWLTEFGLTPSSRCRITVGDSGESDDPAEIFFQKQQ